MHPWQGAVALTGGAVADGVVCADGEGVEKELSEVASDEESLTLRLDVTITCSDGSGEFVVRDGSTLAVEDGVPVEEDVTGSWTIVSGTEDYGELTGSGDSFTEGLDVTTKTYFGKVSSG